jgi:hypothetical protein
VEHYSRRLFGKLLKIFQKWGTVGNGGEGAKRITKPLLYR